MIFREVARAGSISAAARRLGWTQPAVSQHLSRLEREAGGALVVRGPGGVHLTEAGSALLARADAIAGELHVAHEELAALSHLRTGRVRLVSFPSAAATLVPVALHALAVDHPGVEVSFVEAEPPEAIAAVLEAEADLAIVFGHDGPPRGVGPLAWHRLVREPVHLVVPRGHPATERRHLRLAALADESWVGGCERCREHLVECCRRAGFDPDVRHMTDDYVVVQNLVAQGLGITLLPASALAAFRHPEVAVVESGTLGQRHIGVVHRPGAESVPATAALIRQLLAVAR